MAVSAAIRAHAPATFLPLKPPLNSNRPNCKSRTKNAGKPPEKAVFLPKVVGVRGLEPRASCSQSRRATNCATPRYKIVELPGRFLPKQARYQLRNTPAAKYSIPRLGRFVNRELPPGRRRGRPYPNSVSRVDSTPSSSLEGQTARAACFTSAGAFAMA